MKLNVLKLTIGQGLPGFMRLVPRTHEGAPAAPMTDEQALRRSVMASMLWESEFYESGVTIAERVRTLVAKVPAEKVTALAVEARTKMKLGMCRCFWSARWLACRRTVRWSPRRSCR